MSKLKIFVNNNVTRILLFKSYLTIIINIGQSKKCTMMKKVTVPCVLCTPFFCKVIILLTLFIPQLPANHILSKSFISETLQKKWHYSIYLPQNLDQNHRYPVIFLLHGMFNTHTTFSAKGFARLIDDLIERKVIQPVIVVFPEGFKHSWWINSDQFGRIQDAFFSDLLPHISQYYPVSVDSRYRVISGISMGGFGAINYAFHLPREFDHLVLFSPALFLASPQKPHIHPQAAKTNWQHFYVLRKTIKQRAFAFNHEERTFNAILFVPRTYNNLHLRYPNILKNLNIHLYYGDADPVTDSGTRFFHDFLVSEHIPHIAHVTKGAGHKWKLWKQDFSLVLESLFSCKESLNYN